MDRNGDLLRTLLEAYRKVTGDQSQPLVVGGCTYARTMENIVAFGPDFPGKNRLEHMPDEFITEEDLKRLKEIYRKALMDILGKEISM